VYAAASAQRHEEHQNCTCVSTSVTAHPLLQQLACASSPVFHQQLLILGSDRNNNQQQHHRFQHMQQMPITHAAAAAAPQVSPSATTISSIPRQHLHIISADNHPHLCSDERHQRNLRVRSKTAPGLSLPSAATSAYALTQLQRQQQYLLFRGQSR
jgi:hypothetical protein